MTYLTRTDNFIRGLGVEAYRVGGSVRDEILGRRVKDADYVVRGVDRQELKRMVAKTGAHTTDLKLRDGQKVGVRAHKPGLGLIEIMLPRTEVKVEKAGVGNERHAFEIVVDPGLSLREDAIRRDFTFNALYKTVSGEHVNGWGNTPYGDMGILDPLGHGVSDLHDGVVRTTHESSFRDDPLRTLRALRFQSQLGFDLADETLGQMVRYAKDVDGLTAKGVSGTALDELIKLLMGDNVAAALRTARDTGVLATLLPELKPMIGFQQQNDHHKLTVDEHTFVALDTAAKFKLPLVVRLALLFHDSGKPDAAWMGEDGFLHFYEKGDKEDHAVVGARKLRSALARLNAPRELRRDAPLLVERHMVSLSLRTKPTKVRKWRVDLGDELLANLFKHRLADVLAKGTVVDNDDLRALARLEQIREDAEKAGVPKSVKDLKDAGLIDGRDLLDMGVEPGEKMAATLKQLLHEVISDPARADREWLLGRARTLAGK